MSTGGLPAEAELLLACARLELDEERRWRVRELLAAGVDAARLHALAEAHGLRPLLFRHLGDGGLGALPAGLETRLWQHGEQLRRRNALIEAELLAVLDALAAADVPAAVHKGPVLARQAWGDPGLREYGDLDILVPAADVPRARERLETLGFEPKFPLAPAVEQAMLRSRAHYHLMLAHRDSGLLVELHWRTDGEFPVEDTADPAWWRALDTVYVGGRAVRCLPRAQTVLALCLHGSKHYWGSLHWLVDVAELARGLPAVDWQWLLARAESMAARRRLALGLRLARRWLGVDLPAPVADWLAHGTDLGELETAIARDWFEPPPPPPTAWQRLRIDSSLYDQRRQRLRHFADTVFRPGLPEWSGRPLPRGLFFLYPPLRLAGLARRQAMRLLRRY